MVAPLVASTGAVARATQAGFVITDQLAWRAPRLPNFQAESAALHRLAHTLATSDDAMLQTVADTAMELCNVGSAGITLLERSADGTATFRRVAVAGRCAAFALSAAPPEDSPSGVTVALGEAQLFSLPQRYFAFLQRLDAEVVEELVVPIPGMHEPWGTIWVMSHEEDPRFDAQHRRVLTSLADFTGATSQIAGTRAVADARAAEAEAARKALELAEVRKDDFIAMLSDELRNPIAPIDSAIKAALRLAQDNDELSYLLKVADR